tara:strand:+ start:342 stop:563 length:222 start_codon:yes stop_codon:yes gene_type:complete
MLNTNVGVYNIETNQAEVLLNVNRAALLLLVGTYFSQQNYALWVKNVEADELTIVTGNANTSEVRRVITTLLS